MVQAKASSADRSKVEMIALGNIKPIGQRYGAIINFESRYHETLLVLLVRYFGAGSLHRRNDVTPTKVAVIHIYVYVYVYNRL